MAFMPDPMVSGGRDVDCGTLNEAQASALETFRLMNATCVYNLTVGPAGVTVY